MSMPLLSKSTLLRGLTCPKSLYLYKNNRDLMESISPQQEAIFEQGTNVGVLAQELFPGGVDCSPEKYYELEKAANETQEAIDRGESIVYEAAFIFDSVYVALDILVKEEEGWKAYEVKSSTSVKEIVKWDAAIQYYVITNSGLALKDISIVLINTDYVKNGAIDVHQLFSIVSVYEDVQNILPAIPSHVASLKGMLGNKEVPVQDIGMHCLKPYTCDFIGHCWSHVPEYSVFNIANLRKNKMFELYSEGVVDIKEIETNSELLNEKQQMQVQLEISQEDFVDKGEIQNFLNNLNYPLYFLDFETMGSAVPIFDHSRPYQQLVFQYSLHIQEEEGGTVIHKEFLAEADGSDPRLAFAEQMIADCGKSGDVIVYNISFEKGKIEDLMELFPNNAEALGGIRDRLVDLMIPFQKRWYYKPEMQGSYSIKKVLPALVPELSYSNLEIKEGGMASTIFSQMAAKTFKGDYEKTRKDLLEYCKLDTWAMVKILEKLYQL